ncbi:hypothetical protein [Meiothermus ruber]|uniref:LPS export ABC transporter periplasmic protein LptC n=1 Tax=Meiothermus ruber (strain ATCC 35948 / DSM 1279 / VKM B-1258 / 21) TaxID=504728 RepID=D3PKT6_MEIRD|nr:hypothetical protein [Meiothermus ruber]ADD28960.1 hypothetical protein Mrub_2207 [Meiothermus ruber DSM 1279]AGK05590.1 hypothetical protein K649_11500 [Meiothermus ruber DSM 1279]MCL6528707.1 hypothetical protein [Meiothermus ruber]GAO75879.1 putative uncharacterized protein [Meiothermus ruber H328]
MKRWWILLTFLSLIVLASRFAGFEVRPRGNSELDVGTGIYTLPTGGTITDNQSGLVLEARYIQYKDGEFIRAQGATLKAREGNFSASSLEYLQKPDTLRMSGVRFSSKEFKALSAQQGLLLGDDVLVLKGEVRSSEPVLEASTLVVDTTKDLALVLGAFTFRDGATTLRGNRPDSTLLLTVSGGKVRASTRVPADVFNRLRPYADKL